MSAWLADVALRCCADGAEDTLEVGTCLRRVELGELSALHPPLREPLVELVGGMIARKDDVGDRSPDAPVVTFSDDSPLNHVGQHPTGPADPNVPVMAENQAGFGRCGRG